MREFGADMLKSMAFFLGGVNAIKLSNSRLKNIFVALTMTKLALPTNNAKVDKNP